MKKLPRGVKITAMRTAAEFIVGDERHGLKHAPSRKQHGENNPYQWQSEKQRRAYFASDGFGGGIPYQRTGDLTDAWTYTESDSNWTSVTIFNPLDQASFVVGDNQQRGHIADGWRHYLDVVKSNVNGAIKAAQRAVDAWINRNAK